MDNMSLKQVEITNSAVSSSQSSVNPLAILESWSKMPVDYFLFSTQANSTFVPKMTTKTFPNKNDF